MKAGCGVLDKAAAYAAVLAAVALIQPQAVAQTRTWSGGGNNANSGNLNNWQEGAPAQNTSYDVVYDPANLVSPFRTTTTYNTTGLGFTSILLKGNETYPGFVLMGSTSPTTLNGPITVQSGSHNFNVTSTVTTDSTWDIAEGAQLKLGSSSPSLTVASDKTITKTGAGNLFMEGSQTGIEGTIQLDAGIIMAQNAAAMGTASLILNSGSLVLVRNNHTSYGNDVAVAGDVTITSGRATIEGVGLNMDLGTLSIGNQTLTVDTGSLVSSGTARIAFGATTLSGNAVFNVTNNAANVATRLVLGAVGGAGQGLAKTGDGELVLSGANTYTGTTTVESGLLLIDGDSSAATGALTVDAGAILGGVGTIGGDISFAAGAKFLFDAASTLTAGGTVGFESFGIADLIGLDATVAEATYTLIAGNVDFANVSNVGLANAVELGGGKSAYFQEGSLQLVVIPEPATLGLVAVSCFGLVVLRRFRL